MNVKFPDTALTLLVIDTTAYSGNFNREICGYTTGLWDGETHGEHEADLALQENGDMVERIMAKSMPLPHAEYDLTVPQAIRATPGRANLGMGKHYDTNQLPARKMAWPAYESIAIFMSKPLDAEEMSFVRERAHAFSSRPTPFGSEPFEIREVYQIHREPDGTETRLP